MKKYSKYENVLSSLIAHVQKHRRAKDPVLEGERSLAELLGTSRKTLSKALDTLSERGVIRRDRITRVLPAHRQRFKYAYVSNAHRQTGIMWYLLCEETFRNLEEKLSVNSWKISSVLFDPENPAENDETLLSSLQEYDVIFNALSLPPERMEKILSALKSQGKSVINTLGENSLSGYSFIMQDYASTGRRAAETLLQAGYRHPVMTAARIGRRDPGFSARTQAFRETMEKAGCPCEEFFCTYRQGLESIFQISDFLADLPLRHKDCVFFPDDAYLDVVIEKILLSGIVPEKLGIIAVDTVRTASRIRFPFTMIDQQGPYSANEISTLIFEYENSLTSPSEIIQRLYEPPLIPGKTVKTMMKDER